MMKRRLMCGVLGGLLAALLLPQQGWSQPTAAVTEDAGFRLSAEISSGDFLWNALYPGAVLVKTTDPTGDPLPGVIVEARVHSGEVALCRGECEPKESTAAVEFTTDEDGEGTVSIDLRFAIDPTSESDFVVDIVATHGGESLTATVVGRVTAGYQGSFLSDVVASEFFLGATFSQEYNDAGESEGFGNVAGLARLSVDTMWGYNKPWVLHTRLELTGSEIPSEKAPDQGTKASDDTLIQYADSFGGSLSAYWFPGSFFAWYKPTSKVPENPYDAFRVGIVGRYGIITRDTRGINGDSVIDYFQAGISFTHHQTGASGPERDNVNVFPVRFAELKYGRYEEFAGVEKSDRIIFDGGIRLANTAGGAIPFYAGLHVNAGDGADDIRIFAGFLFQLDKLATFFR